MEKLILIAFLLMIVQGIFTYFQVNNYRKTVRKLKSKGYLGIGIEKGYLKAGKMVIIVSDNLGKIVTGEEMKGRTIFSRFKEIKGIENQDVSRLKEKLSLEKKKDIALFNALEKIELVLLDKENSF